MASFQNYATLSYQGGTTNSNTVTGELRASLTLTKQAVLAIYAAGDRVTYVLSLVNSGTTALQGLTVTDNLGAYLQGEVTRTPLTYTPDSLQLYLGGVLQAAPVVTVGPPLRIGPFDLPAGENALLLYEAAANEYAPLHGPDASIYQNPATGDRRRPGRSADGFGDDHPGKPGAPDGQQGPVPGDGHRKRPADVYVRHRKRWQRPGDGGRRHHAARHVPAHPPRPDRDLGR